MKKRMIKNLLLTVIMAVLCFAVCVTASAEDRAIIDSGECGAQGDNVIWTLYDDGELVISGEGEMEDDDFYSSHSHWYEYDNLVKAVIIEEGITSISKRAFFDCDSLTSVNIPSSVVELGYGVFAYCDNLKNVVLEEGLPYIGSSMFSKCYNLESIIIPDSVTSILDDAFGEYCGIKEINIPANVEFIGDTAFWYCYNLEAINVDPENKFYSSDEHGVLFNKDKTKLMLYPNGKTETKYVVPESVKIIGTYAFFVHLYIEEVVLPDNLEIIEEMSFACSPSLLSVTIPASVELIDSVAFCYSMFIEDIYIKGMDTNFGEYALTTGNVRISVSREELLEFAKRFVNAKDDEEWYKMWYEVDEYLIYIDGLDHPSVYGHSVSTAESYANEYGVEFIPTHFYEDDWTYDYDNMIRYRKCIHCDELETEPLETTGNGDVEIIEPVDPDTDFVVDVITDYVIIEEALANGIAGDWEIVKAFDITMTGKDGVHVQPDGTVKVKLPLDWSKDGIYKVYRVNEDGTLTDMEAYRQGSHMVFDTDHFSVYVIVDESEKTDVPITPDEPVEETKANLFTRLLDLIKAFFELITSFFNK